MSKAINIGVPPTFWMIRRPGLQWCAAEMEKIQQLFCEDGFRIVRREIWPLTRGGSALFVSHSSEGAATLFVLKYSDVLRENRLTFTQYKHNVRKNKELETV